MASAPAHAQKFSFPLKCSLGKDCWVLSYVDMDAEQGSATDYKCNARAEDDNKGTDIAIRDRRAMTDGVDVLAASNGTVMRMRDGENDDAKTEEDLADIKARNRDCGNGILSKTAQSLTRFQASIIKRNAATPSRDHYGKIRPSPINLLAFSMRDLEQAYQISKPLKRER